MKVLILADENDAHAKAVAHELAELSAHVDFFNYDLLLEQCTLSFRLGQRAPICLIERQSQKLDLDAYYSIWFRRPGRIIAPQFIEPWITEMVEKETRGALDGMLKTLSCLWVDFPLHHFAATAKLWQLKVAQDVGFSVPETLVTNNPDLVREFFHECGGEVIHKLINDQTALSIPLCEVPAGLATLPLRIEDLPFIDQVSHAPHLFQKYISKSFELRATIVAEQIFCISIDSQSGQGKIDWRSDYTVQMKAYELPDEIKAKCLDLMRRLKLNYGAIDLIYTPDGEYVFLEINPGGQYLWMERCTTFQISLEIAKLLTGKCAPLVL